MRRVHFAALAGAAALCCGTARAEGGAEATLPRVEFLAEAGLSPRLEGDKRAVGGLSGLTYRAADDRWFAVSDDKDEPRVYTLKIALDAALKTLTVSAEAVAELPRPPEDAESIAIEADGSLLVGYERPFAVIRWTPEPERGPLRRLLKPQPLAMPAIVLRGMRINRGFESVAVIANAATGVREIWAATESSLKTDGPEATDEAGALCRVVVWDASSGALLREHAHRTLPTPKGLLGLPCYNSLAEWTALGDGRLLALERSFTVRAGFNGTLRVVTPNAGETDIRGRTALSLGAALVPLRAAEIGTLAAIGAPELVNFEGMAIGAALTDAKGGRLLVLIADDNFSTDGQPPTRVLALRILEK